MRTIICSFVAALMVLPISTPSLAMPYCSEPHKPYCVDGFAKPRSDAEFQRCRSEVENYLRDVERYARCLREEANDAIRESDRIVERFNCMAKGNNMCF